MDETSTSSATARTPEHLSRPQAIERLRKRLRLLTDEEHCLCSVAGELGVFCRGFQRLSEAELRQRFSWIARKRPGISRQDLEALVNLYHLGRQQVTGAVICCDVETREHCGCDGWNLFDNRTLERFFLELTGRPVEIG
jgi:hypothetical protein